MAEYVGSEGADAYAGTPENDDISGRGGADTLAGAAGNDTLDGGSGGDVLRGGAGNDVYIVDGGDRIEEDFGDGVDEVRTGLASYELVDTDLERLTGTGATGQSLVGNHVHNTITGGAGDDYLDGGPPRDDSNDSLIGGGGNDFLVGAGGSDTAGYLGLARSYGRSGDRFERFVSGGPEGGQDRLNSVEVVDFVDGAWAFGESAAVATLLRLYDAAFGRSPDSAGFEHWLGRTGERVSFDTIADQFVVSTEFDRIFGSLDDRGFVQALYRLVLNREGEAAGVDYWVDYMADGGDRGDVLLRFSESREHVKLMADELAAGVWLPDEDAAFLARLYHAAFDRLPDDDGLIAWHAALTRGTSPDAIADAFIATAEFQAIYGGLSDEDYVRELYRTALDREGDAPGIAAWTDYLQTHDRGDLLLVFTNSVEHVNLRQAFIDDGVMFT